MVAAPAVSVVLPSTSPAPSPSGSGAPVLSPREQRALLRAEAREQRVLFAPRKQIKLEPPGTPPSLPPPPPPPPPTLSVEVPAPPPAAPLQLPVAFKQRSPALVPHPAHHPIIQQQQVLALLAGQENVIAMGDFNFRPDTPQYALTTAQLADAFVLAGAPATPGLDPARRIDHIFVSPGTALRSAEYIASPVSDHPGLVVEIGP